MTHLGPYLSYSFPTTTMVRAHMTVLSRMAADTQLRLQPNSASMGFMRTPIRKRTPALKKRMAHDAASTYQP